MTKAKYLLYISGIFKYSFVTTTRNTEDCINILLDKFSLLIEDANYYRIEKIENGVREIVWGKKSSRLKPVIDIRTGEYFPSINKCAKARNVSADYIWIHIKRQKGDYSYAS